MLLGVGLSFIRPSFNRHNYNAVVIDVRDNYYIVSSSLERLYVYEPAHSREIGDVLAIYGDKEELDMYPLESEFDFKEYLNNKGIYSKLIVKKIEVKFANPIKLHKIKHDFILKLDDNSKGIASSLLFGYSKESELYDISQSLHLMRLISSSGIYLFFLLFIIKKGLNIFIKKEKIVDILSIALLSPYLIFSFPKFVVIKFFVIKLLRWINKYPLKDKFKYLDIVSFSGIVFLLFDHHLALQDGFFLSYFIPILSFMINGSFRIRSKIKKRLLITLMIFISFLPFEAKYYSEISIFSLPLQFIVTPIYVVIFLISLLCFIGIPFTGLLGAMVGALTKSLNFISPIMLKIYLPSVGSIEIFIFESLFILLLYFASIRLKPLRNLVSYILTGVFVIYLFPIQYFVFDYVSFINVGQGDSTLIKYHNSTILIDTGGSTKKDIATEVLIPYFKKKQIYKIDLVITTHDDFDHSGALGSLAANFTVVDYKKDYQSFPMNFNGLKLTNYNVYPDLWKEENDESLVIGFKVNNYNYLIMGDAPKAIEKEIMKNNKSIPCDILKVGHHGSKTSTSDEFIKYLRPKVGIISCGRDNSYGHPHAEVLTILKRYNVKIRRTDLESTITF